MAGLQRVLEPTKRASPVMQTTGGIKCANACDAYSKTRHIVKVIKVSVWETMLKGFIDLFASRRELDVCPPVYVLRDYNALCGCIS